VAAVWLMVVRCLRLSWPLLPHGVIGTRARELGRKPWGTALVGCIMVGFLGHPPDVPLGILRSASLQAHRNTPLHGRSKATQGSASTRAERGGDLWAWRRAAPVRCPRAHDNHPSVPEPPFPVWVRDLQLGRTGQCRLAAG